MFSIFLRPQIQQKQTVTPRLGELIGGRLAEKILSSLSPYDLKRMGEILDKGQQNPQAFFNSLRKSVSNRLIYHQGTNSLFTPYEINSRLRFTENFFDILKKNINKVADSVKRKSFDDSDHDVKAARKEVDEVLQKSIEESGILQNVTGITDKDLAFLDSTNIVGNDDKTKIISYYRALAGNRFFKELKENHCSQYDSTRDDVGGVYYPRSKPLTELIYNASPIPKLEWVDDKGLYRFGGSNDGFYMRDRFNEKVRDFEQDEYVNLLYDFAEKIVGIKGVIPRSNLVASDYF